MKDSNLPSISLNKYISDTGICSRREADEIIKEKRILLNGVIAEKGNRVFDGDDVILDGDKISSKPSLIYLAFNKPIGVVCTTDLNEEHNIIDFIKHPQRIFPIGRLDKPSQGLIFLTNDGDIVNKILRAGNNHEKEYVVTVDKPIDDHFIKKMSKGIPILDTVTQKCAVEKLSQFRFKIILTQGLNRQIRRMCAHLSYKVTQLKRIRIMNINLRGIELGKWRYLSSSEMEIINNMIASSSKTEEASKDKNKTMG